MNTKLKTIRGILMAVLLVQAVSAETVFTNEFWISTVVQTNGGENGVYGSGTLDYPYDGSTQQRFNSVMQKLCGNYTHPNSTIHILAGTYITLGWNSANQQGVGWQLQQGQKLLGSGIDNTIIQLVSNAISPSYVIGNYQIGCSNIVVADLTLDGNYSLASGSKSYGGLSLWGDGGFVARRVKVINVASVDPDNPVGGITIYCGGGTNNSEGNLIEECEEYSVPGVTACGGFGFNVNIDANGPRQWISGIMRNNRIVYSYSTSWIQAKGMAIGGCWMRNTLIEGNYVKGAGVGFCGDTGGYTNVTVAHNVFEDCTCPVFLYNNNILQNLMFCYNTFSSTTSSNTSPAFWFANIGSYTNIDIIGNTVTFNGNPPASGSQFLCAGNITGLIVANNMVEPSLVSSFPGCANVSMYNNYDLSGNFLTNLNQVAPPNGVTKRTVMSPTNTVHHSIGINTNYASYADEYIGVKGFPGTYPDTYTQEADIVLPSAVGHAGKDFIIADESGNLGYSAPNWWKKIQIKSTSPDQINGGTSITNSTPYAGMTVISDGTNWFAY